MTVTVPATETKYWTAADYLAQAEFGEGELYEVLNGELIMSPSPTLRHQEIVMNIAEILRAFVRENRLGKVYISPIDVVLGDALVIPDVVYVSNERAAIRSRERVIGAPDLVVEVLSLSTSKRDLRDKWELYAEQGVLEYWIVNPETETLEIRQLVNGAYVLRGTIHRHTGPTGEGAVRSPLFEALPLDGAAVFAE